MAWFGLFNSKPKRFPREHMPRSDRGEIDLDAMVASVLKGGDKGRHWDALDTTEENRTQWLRADGRTINELLLDHYDVICNRSELEARRNPTVEGVIKSHANDVAGPEGPRLQCKSDDESWNAEAEDVWKEIAQEIDGAGKLTLGEWLRQDVYQSWVTGDMLCQIVDDPQAKTVVKTRIHPISPKRLRSPLNRPNAINMMLGIERNNLGRAKNYYISDEVLNEYGVPRVDMTRVPAGDMLHYFEMLEPGQVRGWPRIASCLQAISDLREFDNAVLDAAKVAAMMAVLMYTSNNDMVTPEENPADVTLKRMGITRLPVGWQAAGLNPTQPAANNTDFRNERSRELGRGVGMPLMQIRLDSSGHNYSSARFDGQLYHRANLSIQSALEAHRVRPVVMMVFAEAMERRILAPRVVRPSDLSFRWPQPPHVDPVKEAMAERIRLENKTLSPQAACANHQLDFDDIIRQWGLANKMLEQNGLPPMLGPVPTSVPELMDYLGMNDPNQNSEGNDNGQAKKTA
jgi:lambda family phage portal protein